MPYTPDSTTPTPELLLPRSDSKNPATTCRGITTAGLPCRRSIASPASSPKSARRASAPPYVLDSTNFYCWQHVNQASKATLAPLAGAIAVSSSSAKPQRRNSEDTFTGKFAGLDLASTVDGSRPIPPQPQPRPQRKKQPSLWEALCCMGGRSSADDDYLEIVRHKQRVSQRPQQNHPASRPPMAQASPSCVVHPPSGRPGIHHMPASAPAATDTASTTNFLRFIPPNLDAKTTGSLLTELSKPISTHDEEGYIYIFWLTPEAKRDMKPSDEDAESLLQPSTPSPKADRRVSARKEELLRAHSVIKRNASATRGLDEPTGRAQRTILLKIGRANNVHRRMAEWTRQCGYDLSLVRSYPYVPASQLPPSPMPSPGGRPMLSPRPSNGVRKVPYAHRVERLIHLELAGQRKKQGECATCGREHREWFEVEASKGGVREVEKVIRRWVQWAEGAASKTKT